MPAFIRENLVTRIGFPNSLQQIRVCYPTKYLRNVERRRRYRKVTIQKTPDYGR